MSKTIILKCTNCDQEALYQSKLGACPNCGHDWLDPNYDLAETAKIWQERLATRASNMWRYWELLPLRDRENIITMGEGFTWETQDRARDIRAAQAAWETSKQMIEACRGDNPRYDLILLDELNIVLRYDYLPLREVVEFLANRPPDLHVVVTGGRHGHGRERRRVPWASSACPCFADTLARASWRLPMAPTHRSKCNGELS